jgi:hypothetical protein
MLGLPAPESQKPEVQKQDFIASSVESEWAKPYKKTVSIHRQGGNVVGGRSTITERGSFQKRKEDKSPTMHAARSVTRKCPSYHREHLHVAINGGWSEHPHTPPTNMGIALRTSHMVAASVLLDQDFARRALLNVLATLSPTLQ